MGMGGANCWLFDHLTCDELCLNPARLVTMVTVRLRLRLVDRLIPTLALTRLLLLATLSSRLLMNGVADANSSGGVTARFGPFRRQMAVLNPLVWPMVSISDTFDMMTARLCVVILGLLLLRPCRTVMVFLLDLT